MLSSSKSSCQDIRTQERPSNKWIAFTLGLDGPVGPDRLASSDRDSPDCSNLFMSPPKPRVLLTNDDGPPDTNSPYVLGLYRHLTNHLGWQVKVILPSSQKSWIGKAYHIKDIVQGNYFYPKENGTGDISPTSRPLKEEELGEWILLDGTPATCANIALHNLYPEEIDLVISGPNFGHNTSAAYSLSSGTVGATMSASLSKKRSIAVSYGMVVDPTPTTYANSAHKLACRIIDNLWNNWGSDDSGLRQGEVDLYSINIPLVEELLADRSLKICRTNLWRNSYGRLFENIAGSRNLEDRKITLPGSEGSRTLAEVPESKNPQNQEVSPLLFKWSPAEMDDLINTTTCSSPVGSDDWALCNGWASVTALRATLSESDCAGEGANWEFEMK